MLPISHFSTKVSTAAWPIGVAASALQTNPFFVENLEGSERLTLSSEAASAAILQQRKLALQLSLQTAPGAY